MHRLLRRQIPKTPLQAVKNFRNAELASLEKNLKTFGSFPEPTPSTDGTIPLASLPNPFLPIKNPKTNKWREPKVSLRRQAELVKKAYATGTLDLLPSGPKKSVFEHRLQRRESFASTPLNLLANAKEKRKAAEASEQPPVVVLPRSEEQLAADIEALENEIASLQLEQKQLVGLGKIDRARVARKEETDKAKLGRLARSAMRKEIEELLPEKQTDLKLLRSSVGTMSPVEGHVLPQSPLAPYGVIRDRLSASTEEVESLRNIALKANQPASTVWDSEVAWVGEYTKERAPGADLGTRLYASKKRMFKLHLHERQRAKIVAKRAVLVRDMAKRVQTYKEYYKKRKPNPLKPSRFTKPPKLPF